VAVTRIEGDFDNSPAVNHMKLRMRFLDPKRNNLPVPPGDPTGKVLEVETKFGMKPLFAEYVGVAAVLPVIARAQGGVGDLDIALAFDVSGSMDDETQLTRVLRRWDPAEAKVKYDVVAQGKLAMSHGSARPQQLEFGSGFNPQLRGATDNSAPGNFPPGVAAPTGFTDVVVNLDEKSAFAGLSEGGFDFPNVATLVEASRGNLENAAVFESSKANTTLGGIVTPRAGYQAKYFQLAAEHIHPLVDAKMAASDFFTLMNKNANTHFSFVAFDDQVGNSPTFTYNQPNVATSYPAGGIGRFPLPAVPLDKQEENTKFADCMGAITNLVASGGTNIGGATNKAIDFYNTESRPNAKKAIILFTDGEPTAGGPLSGNPRQNCILAAQKARSKGIAVYTVGLALNPALLPTQREVLGDNTPQGMAKIAGNGSKFFPVTSSSNIRAAFANIARHLSTLVE
jgi:hypothetical protein